MKRLVESLSPDVEFRPSGDGCMVATFPIPELDRTPTASKLLKGTPLYRLLAQVAGADVTVRPRATHPPPEPEYLRRPGLGTSSAPGRASCARRR